MSEGCKRQYVPDQSPHQLRSEGHWFESSIARSPQVLFVTRVLLALSERFGASG
jgi:hypothetical protein